MLLREALIALMLLVSACAFRATPEDNCAAYGVTQGTPEWGQCLQVERQIAAQEAAARQAGVVAAAAGMRTVYGY